MDSGSTHLISPIGDLQHFCTPKQSKSGNCGPDPHFRPRWKNLAGALRGQLPALVWPTSVTENDIMEWCMSCPFIEHRCIIPLLTSSAKCLAFCPFVSLHHMWRSVSALYMAGRGIIPYPHLSYFIEWQMVQKWPQNIILRMEFLYHSSTQFDSFLVTLKKEQPLFVFQ